ncbi:MAG: glucose-1-phosphate adenylyltransferase subunit GlgD [Oscillospiraceae bacterium]|nr:glucose-1-phosphate adenylyltransferase subunit GlgD [Oscillospiraceae bacterium]
MGINLAGIVFANLYDDKLPELTARRTMGSVPFGGKYRMVDFTLSNMSNSGINNVALVTRKNFHSLMDHVGSGAAWDLSKRRTGLVLLPPYGGNSFENRIESLYHIHGYIENLSEEYILLASADNAANIDYQKMFEYHLKSEADITILYKNMEIPENSKALVVLDMNESGRITKMLIDPKITEPCKCFTDSIIISRALLLNLVHECMSLNTVNFKKHLLQNNVDKLKIYGYEFTGHYSVISSLSSYYKENIKLMCPEVRAELFNPQRPIYTKVRDDAPCRYGLTSKVKGSLVSQGCVIDGEVENSILSKGVHIAKGAKVKNCIIMQDTKIGAGAELEYVIIDKDCVVTDMRKLSGCETYPMYIAKQTTV